MKEVGAEIILPDNPAPHIIEWLFDVGPSQQTGMGEAPISYRDLQAWQEVIGVVLAPWEARLLRKLSHTHIAAGHEASALDCPIPFTGLEGEVMSNREVVSQRIKAIFGLGKQKPKK